MNIFKRIAEWWNTFWYGKPCPKHPGHRDREMDTEIITHDAMSPNMCSECFAEMESQYGPF